MSSLYLKDPVAVLDFAFDWSSWMQTGETITTQTVTAATGLTITQTTQAAGVVTVWLSGGTAGHDYPLTCRITTSAGRTDERTLTIRCTDR